MAEPRMMVAAVLLVCLGVAFGCSPATSDTPTSAVTPEPSQTAPATSSATPGTTTAGVAAPRRIVILGDSNTATHFTGFGQGPPWPEIMASEIETRLPGAKVDLVNTAVFGRTSEEMLTSLEGDCLSRSPDIVLMMIGTNDPANGIPLGETEDNVWKAVRLIKRVKGSDGRQTRVVLMQPPVAQSHRIAQTAAPFPLWAFYDATENPDNSLKPMKDAYADIAQDADIALVPTWDRFAALGYDGSQPIRSEFLFDGLHLSGVGQQRVAEWAAEAVAQVW